MTLQDWIDVYDPDDEDDELHGNNWTSSVFRSVFVVLMGQFVEYIYLLVVKAWNTKAAQDNRTLEVVNLRAKSNGGKKLQI